MTANFVYLASGSPRRRALLAQIGVEFQVLTPAVDETHTADESAASYVLRIALAKGVAGALLRPAAAEAPVLSADTTVVRAGRVLGKPGNAAEGVGMLLDLSGTTHEVLTAVALLTTRGVQSRLCRSEVTFRPIGRAEAEAYWVTGEPLDKAGGYAIQGRAAVFVADLRGSYTGVMGLPLYETALLLADEGVPRWR